MLLLCVGLTFGFLATYYVQYGSVPPEDFQRMRDHCWWSWQRWFCTQMSGLRTTRDETLFLSWYSIRWKNDCLYNHQQLVMHYVPNQLLTGLYVYSGPNSIEVWLKKKQKRDIRSDCFVLINPLSSSCTFCGSVHLHLTNSKSLLLSRNNDVHIATCHPASTAVVCVCFSSSDVGNDSTPKSGRSARGWYP